MREGKLDKILLMKKLQSNKIQGGGNEILEGGGISDVLLDEQILQYDS